MITTAPRSALGAFGIGHRCDKQPCENTPMFVIVEDHRQSIYDPPVVTVRAYCPSHKGDTGQVLSQAELETIAVERGQAMPWWTACAAHWPGAAPIGPH